jgi:hypothetical protein
MWESTVEVTRKAVVQAAPERAWSLVSDSAAWSLRPGHFAFDVPQVTEAGRLRCWFVSSGKGLGCSVHEVREVRDDVAGQVISLRSGGTMQPGRQAFTLSVQPDGRGSMVALTTTVTVHRESKADYHAFWRKELRAWLSAMADVLEGRRPWPEAGIPAPIWKACADLPRLVSPQGTSTAVLIGAPPDLVWQAIRAPGIPADPRQPYTAICAGLIPGAPERQPGELRYVIVRHAEGPLIGTVSMVRELTEGRSVLAQRLEPPHHEMQYLLEPAPGGTRLQLTMCWPDAPVTDKGEELRSHLTQSLQHAASAWQAAIEGTAHLA